MAADIRQAWKTAFGQYRRASRRLTAPGAIETANEALRLMRALSNSFCDVPRVAYPWETWERRPTETKPGRLRGPYRSGRLFLARS